MMMLCAEEMTQDQIKYVKTQHQLSKVFSSLKELQSFMRENPGLVTKVVSNQAVIQSLQHWTKIELIHWKAQTRHLHMFYIQEEFVLPQKYQHLTYLITRDLTLIYEISDATIYLFKNQFDFYAENIIHHEKSTFTHLQMFQLLAFDQAPVNNSQFKKYSVRQLTFSKVDKLEHSNVSKIKCPPHLRQKCKARFPRIQIQVCQPHILIYLASSQELQYSQFLKSCYSGWRFYYFQEIEQQFIDILQSQNDCKIVVIGQTNLVQELEQSCQMGSNVQLYSIQFISRLKQQQSENDVYFYQPNKINQLPSTAIKSLRKIKKLTFVNEVKNLTFIKGEKQPKPILIFQQQHKRQLNQFKDKFKFVSLDSLQNKKVYFYKGVQNTQQGKLYYQQLNQEFIKRCVNSVQHIQSNSVIICKSNDYHSLLKMTQNLGFVEYLKVKDQSALLIYTDRQCDGSFYQLLRVRGKDQIILKTNNLDQIKLLSQSYRIELFYQQRFNQIVNSHFTQSDQLILQKMIYPKEMQVLFTNSVRAQHLSTKKKFTTSQLARYAATESVVVCKPEQQASIKQIIRANKLNFMHVSLQGRPVSFSDGLLKPQIPSSTITSKLPKFEFGDFDQDCNFIQKNSEVYLYDSIVNAPYNSAAILGPEQNKKRQIKQTREFMVIKNGFSDNDLCEIRTKLYFKRFSQKKLSKQAFLKINKKTVVVVSNQQMLRQAKLLAKNNPNITFKLYQKQFEPKILKDERRQLKKVDQPISQINETYTVIVNQQNRILDKSKIEDKSVLNKQDLIKHNNTCQNQLVEQKIATQKENKFVLEQSVFIYQQEMLNQQSLREKNHKRQKKIESELMVIQQKKEQIEQTKLNDQNITSIMQEAKGLKNNKQNHERSDKKQVKEEIKEDSQQKEKADIDKKQNDKKGKITKRNRAQKQEKCKIDNYGKNGKNPDDQKTTIVQKSREEEVIKISRQNQEQCQKQNKVQTLIQKKKQSIQPAYQDQINQIKESQAEQINQIKQKAVVSQIKQSQVQSGLDKLHSQHYIKPCLIQFTKDKSDQVSNDTAHIQQNHYIQVDYYNENASSPKHKPVFNYEQASYMLTLEKDKNIISDKSSSNFRSIKSLQLLNLNQAVQSIGSNQSETQQNTKRVPSVQKISRVLKPKSKRIQTMSVIIKQPSSSSELQISDFKSKEHVDDQNDTFNLYKKRQPQSNKQLTFSVQPLLKCKRKKTIVALINNRDATRLPAIQQQVVKQKLLKKPLNGSKIKRLTKLLNQNSNLKNHIEFYCDDYNSAVAQRLIEQFPKLSQQQQLSLLSSTACTIILHSKVKEKLQVIRARNITRACIVVTDNKSQLQEKARDRIRNFILNGQISQLVRLALPVPFIRVVIFKVDLAGIVGQLYRKLTPQRIEIAQARNKIQITRQSIYKVPCIIAIQPRFYSVVKSLIQYTDVKIAIISPNPMDCLQEFQNQQVVGVFCSAHAFLQYLVRSVDGTDQRQIIFKSLAKKQITYVLNPFKSPILNSYLKDLGNKIGQHRLVEINSVNQVKKNCTLLTDHNNLSAVLGLALKKQFDINLVCHHPTPSMLTLTQEEQSTVSLISNCHQHVRNSIIDNMPKQSFLMQKPLHLVSLLQVLLVGEAKQFNDQFKSLSTMFKGRLNFVSISSQKLQLRRIGVRPTLIVTTESEKSVLLNLVERWGHPVYFIHKGYEEQVCRAFGLFKNIIAVSNNIEKLVRAAAQCLKPQLVSEDIYVSPLKIVSKQNSVALHPSVRDQSFLQHQHSELKFEVIKTKQSITSSIVIVSSKDLPEMLPFLQKQTSPPLLFVVHKYPGDLLNLRRQYSKFCAAGQSLDKLLFLIKTRYVQKVKKQKSLIKLQMRVSCQNPLVVSYKLPEEAYKYISSKIADTLRCHDFLELMQIQHSGQLLIVGNISESKELQQFSLQKENKYNQLKIMMLCGQPSVESEFFLQFKRLVMLAVSLEDLISELMQYFGSQIDLTRNRTFGIEAIRQGKSLKKSLNSFLQTKLNSRKSILKKIFN